MLFGLMAYALVRTGIRAVAPVFCATMLGAGIGLWLGRAHGLFAGLAAGLVAGTVIAFVWGPRRS